MAAATKPDYRVLITMPPRHGKSYLSSHYFPAWYLLNYPEKRIILASYEADFAAQWGRKARDVVERRGPRFNVKVDKRSSAADRWDIENDTGGMQTAGIGGPITGKGADLLIIDDPVKNAEEAESITKREKSWDWYGSTAYTRLEPGASMVVIQTRWHHDDLAGRILKRSKEKWVVLNLPALAEKNDLLGREQGEALWPARFDVAALEAIRGEITEMWFAALYQQRPTPREGAHFKADWFNHTFRRMPTGFEIGGKFTHQDLCCWFATVDPAGGTSKSADYTVIAIWCVTPDNQLLAVHFDRSRTPVEHIPTHIQAVCERAPMPLLFVAIENAFLQEQLIVKPARKLVGMPPIRAVNPQGKDKFVRAIPAMIAMEGGQILWKEGAKWLDFVKPELLQFTGNKDEHDDVPDNLSYAVQEWQRGLLGSDLPLIFGDRPNVYRHN